MDIAKCTIDNETYKAVNFAKLPEDELTVRRRNLICIECKADAFFRKESKSGQAACFGATPHKEGCELAAPEAGKVEGEGGDEDIIHNPGKVIEIDLNFGGSVKDNVDIKPDDGDTNTAGKGRHTGKGSRPNANSHRRLSTLLRNLRRSFEYRNSDQLVELSGHEKTKIKDFFVKFPYIRDKHDDKFHGYWGAITDAKFMSGNLWLNSGGPSSVSIFIAKEDVKTFLERFKFEDEESLAGINVLALGTKYTSQKGKQYIKCESLSYITVNKT